jgi:RNA polymerase sigma factor (sigma-70 family)
MQDGPRHAGTPSIAHSPEPGSGAGHGDERSRRTRPVVRNARTGRGGGPRRARRSVSHDIGQAVRHRLRICGDRSSAEDVLHEVYTIVWKRAGGFEAGPASSIAWLATIARNRSIDWVRAHGRRTMRPIEDALDVADDTPDQTVAAEQAEIARRLYECLEELHAPQRDAIRTAFVDGMTYAEIADARGVPLGTMKSWVRRGLLQLRGCVGDD